MAGVSINLLISRAVAHLSQRHDALYVGVADVEVGDFFRLPGSELSAGWVLHVPVKSLGGRQGDHVVHLKVQLHHLIGRTVQPAETERFHVDRRPPSLAYFFIFLSFFFFVNVDLSER